MYMKIQYAHLDRLRKQQATAAIPIATLTNPTAPNTAITMIAQSGSRDKVEPIDH